MSTYFKSLLFNVWNYSRFSSWQAWTRLVCGMCTDIFIELTGAVSSFFFPYTVKWGYIPHVRLVHGLLSLGNSFFIWIILHEWHYHVELHGCGKDISSSGRWSWRLCSYNYCQQCFKLFRCLALVYFSCFRGVKNLTSRASCAERDRDVSTVTPVTRWSYMAFVYSSGWAESK